MHYVGRTGQGVQALHFGSSALLARQVDTVPKHVVHVELADHHARHNGQGSRKDQSEWPEDQAKRHHGKHHERRRQRQQAPRDQRLFDGLLALGNDVMLFAEQWNDKLRAARGNFPQAFSHVGLLTAAASIAEAVRRRGDDEGHVR